jgi:hypothetical protein
MPIRPKGPCRVPTCPGLEQAHGFCERHQGLYSPPVDRRGRTSHGYGHGWARIRREVLRAHGIPEAEFHLWDLDHRPPYNPKIEPDHRRYDLVPMRHGTHSTKTARQDGAFGNPRR